MQKTGLKRHSIRLHLYQDRYQWLLYSSIQINQIMPMKLSHNRLDEPQGHVGIRSCIISNLTDWHLGHTDHFAPLANQVTNGRHYDSKPLKCLILQTQPTPTRFCEISPNHGIKGETLKSYAISPQHHHIILGVMHVLSNHGIFQHRTQLFQHIVQRQLFVRFLPIKRAYMPNRYIVCFPSCGGTRNTNQLSVSRVLRRGFCIECEATGIIEALSEDTQSLLSIDNHRIRCWLRCIFEEKGHFYR